MGILYQSGLSAFSTQMLCNGNIVFWEVATAI